MMEHFLSALRRMIPRRMFTALQPIYHFGLAFLAALWHRFPSRRLIVIGVTGTKGKTTVVHLLHEILAASGARVASLSSLRFRIGEEEEENQLKMTMPGRFFIQRFLGRALEKGCGYVVLEVTSQGIAQHRHRFIRFAGAVVTNVAPEHLEAHGGFEQYLRAKLDLFWRLPREAVAVINRDDPHWRRFGASTGAHRIFYSRDEIVMDSKRWRVADLEIGSDGVSFTVADQTFVSVLRGEFNFYNILAATAAALGRHIQLEKIAGAVGRFSGVAGRMEFVQYQPFAVVIDYAHTPDSLRKVYETLRRENQKPETRNQKFICVLGSAGGGRDRWKRPELGRIAAEFCNEIILTNEDPYDEDPRAIVGEIHQGISSPAGRQASRVRTRIDRRGAIRIALRSARAGDTVVITGKGAEPWIMGPAGEKIPWDDREVAREELRKLL